MIDVQAMSLRFGPLAEVAGVYAGPDASGTDREAVRAFIVGVMTRRRDDLLAAVLEMEKLAGKPQADHTPSEVLDAQALMINDSAGRMAAGLPAVAKELAEVRAAMGDSPHNGALFEVMAELEGLLIRFLAAARQHLKRHHRWANETPLTFAELAQVRASDDRHRAKAGSPLVCLLVGVAVTAGLALSGPVVAGIAGLATFLVSVAAVDRALMASQP